jgi:rhodanese-related sulfurtransferase
MENCMSKEDLKHSLLVEDHVVLIDVRSQVEYNDLHIPVAINIPVELLEGIIPFLDKEKSYITSCGKGGGRSKEAADLLTDAGIKSSWLCGGTFGWFEK